MGLVTDPNKPFKGTMGLDEDLPLTSPFRQFSLYQ